MICTKCNNPGVENQALGKVFWYCRDCKDEIRLEEPRVLMSTRMIGLREALEMYPVQPTPPPWPGSPGEFNFDGSNCWLWNMNSDCWERLQ